jgi:hypothetical protein
VELVQLTEGSRRVDRPAVAVKDHTVDVTAPRGDGHGERVSDELGAHVIRSGPAEHPPTEQINDGGQVEPAFAGVQMREVAAPHDVGCGRVEVTPDVIVGRGRALVDDRGAHPAAAGLALEAQLTRDPTDTLVVDLEPLLDEPGGHPRDPVRLIGRGPDQLDLSNEHGVVERSLRWAAGLPVVEPGPGHLQDPAPLGDGPVARRISLLLGDERVHRGHTFFGCDAEK